jgi:hypothetical protein
LGRISAKNCFITYLLQSLVILQNSELGKMETVSLGLDNKPLQTHNKEAS